MKVLNGRERKPATPFRGRGDPAMGSSFHRPYGSKPKTDLKKLRPMILRRLEGRAGEYPIQKMVPLAQQVLRSRNSLYRGVSEILKVIPVSACKYLVPAYLTVGQFVCVVRKRIKLSPENAIFVFVKNILPPTAALLSAIYEENKDEDGFLYMTESGENHLSRDV